MKKIIAFYLVLSLSLIFATTTLAKSDNNSQACTTIQSGLLTTKTGDPLEIGFDDYGYNYQARLFNGWYDNYSRPSEILSNGDSLLMKWNDAWLSNKDCDGDKLLDRHYGYNSYIGSGAWLTNQQSGEYDNDGELCKWNYFVKIVAVPAYATKIGGIWYAVDGTEIGSDIWGEFAITQEVYNDPCNGYHGLQYVSPAGAGLGMY